MADYVLFCFFNVLSHVFTLGFEDVLAWHETWIEESSHVHGVTAETFAVDSVIEKDVAIETVVVPAL